MKLNILFTLIAALCFGCGSKTFTDLDEFERFIRSEDSPYVQTIVKNGVKLTLRYMPTDAMMIHHYREFYRKKDQLRKNLHVNSVNYDSTLTAMKVNLQETRKKYLKALYFRMTIGYEDDSRDVMYAHMGAGFQAYSDWLHRLSYDQRHIISSGRMDFCMSAIRFLHFPLRSFSKKTRK